MKHLLSVPKSAGRHALLCFLHGYDEAAQLPLAGDIWHRHADDVQALVAATIERLGGDRHRAYLTGFSFGANGVFDLALLQPGLWAALWAVDPTRVPKRAITQPIWLSVGEVARWQKKAFIEALLLQDASRHRYGRRLCADHADDHVGAARRAFALEQPLEALQLVVGVRRDAEGARAAAYCFAVVGERLLARVLAQILVLVRFARRLAGDAVRSQRLA